MTILDHIGLSVADLQAQQDWYAKALGLEPVGETRIEELELRIVFLVDPESGWSLELLERQGSRQGLHAPDPPTALLTRGFGHICLRVSDVQSTYDHLLETGAAERKAPGPSPELGVQFAFVADPEGNLIEILDRRGAPGKVVNR